MAIASAQSNASGLFVGLKFDGLCKRKSPAETVSSGKKNRQSAGPNLEKTRRPERLSAKRSKAAKRPGRSPG
jgi:hypothetical protein